MTSQLEGLLERLVRLLDDSGVPFMIAGSFASAAHGLPRTTQDLDVVVEPPDEASLLRLVAAMPLDDYYVDRDAVRDAWRRRSMFNVIDQASGWKVDFIIRKDRPFSRDEFQRRMKLTLLGVPVFVASAEDTVIAKLEWSKNARGSERQRRDVAGILLTLGDALDRTYVERWIQTLDLSDEWDAARLIDP